MTGQKLCDENRCLCKGMRGSFFPIYCSPILVWEELRFHQHRGSGKIVPNRMRVRYVRCFRIDEAYFRLGFGYMWRFIWENPAAGRELSGMCAFRRDAKISPTRTQGLADVPWSHLAQLWHCAISTTWQEKLNEPPSHTASSQQYAYTNTVSATSKESARFICVDGATKPENGNTSSIAWGWRQLEEYSPKNQRDYY